MKKLFLVFMLLFVTLTKAQEYFPINTGVKTSKGVVGLDLTRLFTGSEGVLGILTEATLKILPLLKFVNEE